MLILTCIVLGMLLMLIDWYDWFGSTPKESIGGLSAIGLGCIAIGLGFLLNRN